MKHTLLFLVMFLFAAGCQYSSAAPANSGSPVKLAAMTQNGPSSWVDAPLDGSNLPMAPYDIVAHGSDVAGMAVMELKINDMVNPVQPGADSNGIMMTFKYSWNPPAPGVYTIAVRSRNSAGAWGQAAQAVVTVAGIITPTITATQTLTSTPTVTLTSTATLTPTATITPAAPVVTGSGSPEQVYYGGCEPNQVAFQASASNPKNVYSIVVFLALGDANSSAALYGWDEGTAMTPSGVGNFKVTIATQNIKGAGKTNGAALLYQFVATSRSGDVIARSPSYQDIALSPCGHPILLPFRNPKLPPNFLIPSVTPVIVK